jgi:hypothetical protein
VEVLQFHSTTQSHWSSGSTICFLSWGSAVRFQGMHKLTMERGSSCQHCLAVLDTLTWLITGLGSKPTLGSFIRHCANDEKSQLWSHIAFPSSIQLLAGPLPPCNTVTGYSPSQVAKLLGGDFSVVEQEPEPQGAGTFGRSRSWSRNIKVLAPGQLK